MIDSPIRSLPLEIAHTPGMEVDPTEFVKFALPDSAKLPEGLGRDASPWLDCGVGWSQVNSPRAFNGFHEAIALWVLSVIAAGRVVLRSSKDFFPSLYVALVATSSLYAKSVTVGNFKRLIGKVGLEFLLSPDDSTPRRFVADLAGRVPENYAELSESEQADVENRIAMCAQRGWFCDEFGSFIESMNSASGIMSEFRGLLRTFDNHPETYTSNTFLRGDIKVIHPYLAMVANLTPADLKCFAAKGSRSWGDGLYARIAFVTPTKNEAPKYGRFPDHELEFPKELTEPLIAWHKRLGMPEVEIEEVEDDEGHATGRYKVNRLSELQPKGCTLGKGVWDSFYRYHDALIGLIYANHLDDLAGNYSRFSEKALRIAILLASLENNNVIEMRHWARGQAIAERWRENLHSLFSLMTEHSETEMLDREGRVLRIIDHLQPKLLTPAQVKSYDRKLSTIEVSQILDGLFQSGVLMREKTKSETFKYARCKP